MAKYLIAIHRVNNYDPLAFEDEAMSRDIDALNDEMVSAGIIIFVGGLRPISHAKSLRLQNNGEMLLSDGPYLSTTEHVGGFWVLQVVNLEEALAWGRKAAIACRASVEVRPFHG